MNQKRNFFLQPPILPLDDLIWQMQQMGKEVLAAAGLQQYEISAYSKPELQCRHNLNYWQFGDYLGIGAGAHGKITCSTDKEFCVQRSSKIKDPKLYLLAKKNYLASRENILARELALEFMLNALRLYQPITIELFQSRTGLQFFVIAEKLKQAQELGFIYCEDKHFWVTEFGHNFLDDLLLLFC